MTAELIGVPRIMTELDYAAGIILSGAERTAQYCRTDDFL